MILRRALKLQGRRFAYSPAKRWTRALATQVNLESIQQSLNSIESSLQNSQREIKSIEQGVQQQSSGIVPRIVDNAGSTSKILKDKTQEEYSRFKTQQRRLNPLGTSIAPHYQPHVLVNHPPRPSDITLELLLASQAHLGHKTSHWNPANARYIFGIRQGIHIISLDVTAAHLRRACRVVSGIAERGGLILFVGTRTGQERCVVKAAELAGGCHLFDRWTPGSITNGHQILGTCKTKVVNHLDQTLPGYDEHLRERPVLKPDLVVCLNPLENWVMLHECGLNAIPTIGIIDTDANPTWVTYPIPANDDSLRCVQVIAGVLGRAGQEGQKRRRELAEMGHVTYTPAQLVLDSKIDGPESEDGDTAVSREFHDLQDPVVSQTPAQEAEL